MNEEFYRLSKLFWSIAAPGNLMILWLGLGGMLMFWAGAGRLFRLGCFMVGSGILLNVLILFVPFGFWALALLEERIPQPKTLPSEIAGIIVLGGSESENVAAARGTLYTNFATMNRMLIFKMLADRYPQAALIYSGGTTRVETHPKLRQADIAERVAQIMMGDKRKVSYERESRTTFENARNSAKMIGDKRKEPWVLVTSAWHMPRALGTFRQQGWNVIPMPVDYSTEGELKPLLQIDYMRNLTALNTFLREICGMVGYYYAGQSDALFPEAK